MKKFAFISTNSIKRNGNFLLNKEKTHKYIFDIAKISVVIFVIIVSGLYYLKYISLSSTEGYFLRQYNNELASLNFQYEILKTELLEKTQENWGNMYGNNQTKTIIEVKPEIVQIPKDTKLSYNK